MAWTIKDIKKRIIYLENKQEKSTSLEEKEHIDQTIASLYDILDYFRADLLGTHYTHSLILEKDKPFIKCMKEFNPLIQQLAIIYAKPEDVIDYEVPLRINTSKDSILKVTKTFYDSIKDKRFTDFFYELYKKRNHLVKFRRKFFIKNLDNDAVAFPIYNTRDVYFLINHDKSFKDYLAVIHEYAHAISALINQNFSLDPCKYLFIEADAIFFEMLANDTFANQKEFEEMALTADLERFYDYIYMAAVIHGKLGIHSNFKDLSKVKKKDIVNHITDVMGYKKESITTEVIYTPISEIYHYVTSYLLAVELYILYKKDSNKALKALYDLITFDSNSNQETMDMLKDEYGIVVGEHVHEYYLSLTKRVEEVQNGKGIQHTIK